MRRKEASAVGKETLFNLDNSVDNSKLHDIFTKYGNILSCKVAMSAEGKSNCFGFVQFESEESANNAIRTANGTIIDGKEIYVCPFMTKGERIQADSGATYTNLYVKNLDSDVTEDLLRQKFSLFGEISSLLISKYENGVSKGFGFVNFVNSDDAKRAKESMHGLNVHIKHINDNVDDNQLKDYFNQRATTAINTLNEGVKFHGKPLYVAIAQSKDERKSLLGLFTANPTNVYPNFGYQLPWRPSGFSPPMGPGGPGFQAPPFPMQYRERMTNHIPRYGGDGYLPFPQEHNQFGYFHNKKNANDQQQRTINANHWCNGHPKLTMSNGETIPSVLDGSSTKAPKGTEDLSTKLAAASAEHRKEMLGQHLYPLVHKLQSGLATKITGMLLEMANAELLLLLESPESLAAKVEEAVQVLELQ
ncbi:unnamed protein product [Dovyalis caffra]|uniref:Polyadenylate-binding protein n=1 Tax=Dovyalis caffra TaxID=77055 RepID=A0AAV1REP9_9ROSI|nr:unnamed protein product [Dovyalis caffra]